MSKNTSSIVSEDGAILDAARRCQDRTRAEIRLLSLIAPDPPHHTYLALRHGLCLDDFEGDDTRLIADAIFIIAKRGAATCHKRGVALCHRLARLFLIEASLWDDEDGCPVMSLAMRWNPPRLDMLFVATMNCIHNEAAAIAAAIRDLRSFNTTTTTTTERP